jgi:AcrR family transcriptional regulator
MARQRLDAEQSRNLILDAVERLMQRDGYAAVNTRSTAIEAGLKPPLVHYHFETTDNLLLSAYRRAAARSGLMLQDAIESDQPLRAIWTFNADRRRTALAAQFMALASERPAIREEMAHNVARFRQLQSEVLQKAVSLAPALKGMDANALAMLIAAVGRAFAMEESIGVDVGHEAMHALVERFIASVEPQP